MQTRHAPRNSAAYLWDWYLSVRRLGLSAVIFHDGLSREFTDRLATDLIRFQSVRLYASHWSLVDLRWAAYDAWLSRSNPYLRYVMATDISDTMVAADPWPWLGLHDLWVAEDAQPGHGPVHPQVGGDRACRPVIH